MHGNLLLGDFPQWNGLEVGSEKSWFLNLYFFGHERVKKYIWLSRSPVCPIWIIKVQDRETDTSERTLTKRIFSY